MDFDKKIGLKEINDLSKSLTEYIIKRVWLRIIIRMTPVFVTGFVFGLMITGGMPFFLALLLIIINGLPMTALIYELYIYFTKYDKLERES